MSKNSNLNYTTSIIHEEFESDGSKKTYIVGNAIEAGVSRNKINYSEEELSAAASTLIGKPLLLNHGDEDVRNIVGKVVEADYDNGTVPFKAVLDQNETKIIQKIRNGFINKVSIGAMFDDARTERDSEGIIQAKGIEFLELSLVPIPGVPNAGISQVLNEKYSTMEVEKMDNELTKQVEELKKKNEELEAKLTEKEETTEETEQEDEKKETVKEEPEASEDFKALQEKFEALEKKVESNKGIVKPETSAPKNAEVWSIKDKDGKQEYYELDTNGKTLY